MNWKLIFGLSLLGLAMAVGTVSLIPSSLDRILFPVVLLISAAVVAWFEQERPFVHGLLVGLVNSVWITGAHLLFFSTYLANHPAEAAMSRSMPLAGSPRLLMALTGPVIGIITGVIIGALALLIRFIRWRLNPEHATTEPRQGT